MYINIILSRCDTFMQSYVNGFVLCIKHPYITSITVNLSFEFYKYFVSQ